MRWKKFEFLVEGAPVSQQTRNRQRRKDWKDKVRQEAEKYWSSAHSITGEAVIFQITYFYSVDRLDVDNIVKPIQDAIIGLAYIDDGRITDLIVRI